MRRSRLVSAVVVATAAASIAVPIATETVAYADAAPSTSATPTTRPLTAAELTAKREADRKRARAERLRQRHIAAVKLRRAIVRYALSRRDGGEYVAGASSAWRFDCSGFVKQVYWKVAHINLPHYSGAQLNLGRGMRVGKRHLEPGDILAWGPNGSQHASLYIGRGRMIGANNPSRDVVIESINSSYWAPRYAGARRVIVG